MIQARRRERKLSSITHHSPPTNLHIRFLVAAGMEQVVESARELGGVHLVLGVKPA